MSSRSTREIVTGQERVARRAINKGKCGKALERNREEIILYGSCTQMSDEVRADSTSTQPAPPIILKFSSPEGVALVRNTLRTLLPFDPHTYQLDGICTCLDGQDLIAICPTGSGKTEFFSMYILMLRALSANPNLCRPSRKVPQDPAMVFVCPTIVLEEDVVSQ